MSSPIIFGHKCSLIPRIAVFDSGVGGLLILKPLLLSYSAHYIYLADATNMPYGNKSPQEITALTLRAITFLESYKPDLIIIACFTATAIALADLQKKISTPLLGMIELVAPYAVKATRNNQIGVLSTRATANSYKITQAIQALNPTLTTIEQACPLLASAIENRHSLNKILQLIKKYIAPLQEAKVDTILLGCTHYEALREVISGCLNKQITLIGAADTIEQTVRSLPYLSNPQTTNSINNLELQLIITGSVKSTLYTNFLKKNLPNLRVTLLRFSHKNPF